MHQQSIFEAIKAQEAMLEAPISWLEKNGCDPKRLVDAATQELERRGRFLPYEQRVRYGTHVLLGQFFVRWAMKHRGRSVDNIHKNVAEREAELYPFGLALMAAGTEGAFKRHVRRFTRKRMIEQAGMTIGTAEEFTTFVGENTWTLAARFLKNFDTSRPTAARGAVRYLQMTAVSWYLVRRTRPIRTDAPNLSSYLRTSSRLSERTVLAMKLAYLPALLTDEERRVLQEKYGFSASPGPRLPIKVIAERLGYKDAAALSRKLYRVRKWCRRSPLAAGKVSQ